MDASPFWVGTPTAWVSGKGLAKGSKGHPDSESGLKSSILFKGRPKTGDLQRLPIALLPGRLEGPGAGLESKKKYGIFLKSGKKADDST
jgi:hypothetical protein